MNFINAFPLGLHFLSRVYFPRLCLLITFFNFVPSLEQLQILHGMNENVCVEGILSDWAGGLDASPVHTTSLSSVPSWALELVLWERCRQRAWASICFPLAFCMAWSPMIRGTKTDNCFSWEAWDTRGKVWWPEVGKALRGTLFGCADNKQSSFGTWGTTDDTGLVRIRRLLCGELNC